MADEKQLQKEIEDIHRQIYNKTNKNMLPVLQLYKKALNDIRGELGKIYSKYSTDGKLDVSTTEKYNILKQMEITLKGYGQELGKIDEKTIKEVLGNNYKEAYFKTAQVIQGGIENVINFNLIRPEMIEKAVNTPMDGKRFSDRIWDNKTKMINTLRNNLVEGMDQGYDIKKLSQNISNTMGSSAYSSLRLVNTETARVVNSAQMEIYNNSKVVQKILWSATLDNKTAEEDASLDGRMWNIDEEHPEPPLHPNCRCCLIPVVDGWKPITRYNQEEGTILDYKTYDEWENNNN